MTITFIYGNKSQKKTYLFVPRKGDYVRVPSTWTSRKSFYGHESCLVVDMVLWDEDEVLVYLM